MQISEARALARELEKNLSELVAQFEQQTSLVVYEVKINITPSRKYLTPRIALTQAGVL